MPCVQLSQLSPYGSGLKYGAMAVALGVPSKTSNKAQVLREFSTSWIKPYAEEAKPWGCCVGRRWLLKYCLRALGRSLVVSPARFLAQRCPMLG